MIIFSSVFVASECNVLMVPHFINLLRDRTCTLFALLGRHCACREKGGSAIIRYTLMLRSQFTTTHKTKHGHLHHTKYELATNHHHNHMIHVICALCHAMCIAIRASRISRVACYVICFNHLTAHLPLRDPA